MRRLMETRWGAKKLNPVLQVRSFLIEESLPAGSHFDIYSLPCSTPLPQFGNVLKNLPRPGTC
jgi:hypothetical protein